MCNEKPMSEEIAIKFCELCNWAYETWVTHKKLFDDNACPKENIERAVYFTSRLSCITQEYSLQQIAKLHDPPTFGKSTNLTIDYIVRFGGWGEEQEEIESIRTRLLDLSDSIGPARNKLLSHNDLETILTDTTLGSFAEGADKHYFDTLQELVNRVHDKWSGGPYPFNDLAKADVQEFLEVLERS